MDSSSITPKATWWGRISTILAWVLVAIGIATILGWLTGSSLLLQPLAGIAPIKFNGAVSLFLVGLTILGLEYQIKHTGWLALIIAGLNLATLGQHLFQIDLHIDELIIHDPSVIETMRPGRVSSVSALIFFLIGMSLFWKAQGTKPRFRLLTEAIIGSVAGSAGFSTLVGYIAELRRQ